MSDSVFNIAKGRGTEWVNRVNLNDPANSVIIWDVLATAGLEADTVLQDKVDMAALVAGTTNYVTQAAVRKTLDQAGGLVVTTDQTNDRVDIDMPDITWVAVLAGDGWSRLVSGYDSDSTVGTDANIVPWTKHDFVVTPDGSDITAVIPVAGFFRAQ
jgi:hypothetical protein